MTDSGGAATPGARVDVVVVGAGVVGLSAARRLAERGYAVAVHDDRSPGGAGSRAAAGVAVPSVRYVGSADMRAFGRAGREALAGDLEELGGAAWCHGEGIVRVARPGAERERLDRLAALAPGDMGTWVPAEELATLEPLLEGALVVGGYVHERGFVVRAGPYVDALAAAARCAGATVEEGVGVTGFAPDGDGLRVETAAGRRYARALVVAAGPGSDALLPSPEAGRVGVQGVRGQLLTVGVDGRSLRRIVSGTLYLAPWGDGEVCVGATEEHTGVEGLTPAGLAVLGGFVARTAPGLRDAPVLRTWSGIRSARRDGRPVVGRLPGEPRVVVATGLGGQGILCGALTGSAAAALVAGAPAPEVAPFAPR